MRTSLTRVLVPFIAVLFAACLIIPALSMASATQPSMFDEPTTQTAKQAEGNADCTLTIKYYEAVFYEDPDVVVDDQSRVLLGEHVVTGLSEGDVISAWDYVVDIPGHMFFDGWPASVTISSDPAQNELTLMYVKLWNSEFTVNYYVMLGADLTADNWADALAPEGVEFIKMGSETFDNQRYDSLVVGDAYEYKLDGMYVIDTYPAQIRLDVNPDNNVINVLYTPDSVNLPDDMEIYEMTTLPDDFEITEAPESNGALPDDTTMSKDDLIALLPDSVLVPSEDGTISGDSADGGNGDGSSEIVDDFIGNDVGEGELDVTDEMLNNTVSKEEAAHLKQVYQTGAHQAAEASRMGDLLRVTPYICIALAAIVIFMVCLLLARRRRDS